MAYREIWHEIIINASPGELYQALTDVKKLAHCGPPRRGGNLPSGRNWNSGFMKFLKEMVVTTLKVDELVRWRATERSES